ncbi:Lysophospholipase L1 [Dietzia kunjamensis subsp. schimae]|uniref:Lysophospholipase L1 n=1 Tax=Dietzia kunjamensis subsp. schimae TaxID=498198 RepID=A0ABY1MWY5_9ACTN|nr:SGNH/GDSL hydrolase family protein [Dietzia kunjamensis]SMO41475.1 Lysophospholipase L1 [Dietzia kunjamensis subsp. schimae]
MTDADDASRRLWMSLGLAAVGTVGAYRGAQEVLTQQARIARRVIPKPTSRPYSGDGLYRPRASAPEPWRPGMTCDVHMMIFGDSLAAGLGADSPDELPGVLLARGLAEESGWNVRLSIKAIVGATSKGLPGQIEAMQIAHGDPDISVILIGGNDITSRNAIGPSARRVGEAVRALRENGSHVVVGTCPDLSIIKPVPQPLRSVMSGLSRRLAAAQAVQARKAGGVPVSLAETLAPEFHRRGESLFSPDRFHPNSAGYELAAGLLLPAVCVALGVWDEIPEEHVPRDAEEAAASLEAAESAAADAASDARAEPDADSSDAASPAEHRESVVARLTKRLTDFVRTHEDADDGGQNTFLHNEDVDGDPESTGEAREAADTLRRRSRILTPTRSTRDGQVPQD